MEAHSPIAVVEIATAAMPPPIYIHIVCEHVRTDGERATTEIRIRYIEGWKEKSYI